MADARAGLSAQLEAFAANTMEYLRRERDLLLDGVGVPDVVTGHRRAPGADRRPWLRLQGGPAHALRPYIREYRPVLIGVDGGADALLEAGYTPDMIIGDMDSVSDAALRCGAEVVVHAYRDGRAPGLERLQRLGIRASCSRRRRPPRTWRCCLPTPRAPRSSWPSAPTRRWWSSSTRAGRAWPSTFLTRLRVGPKLVDAKGVSRLYHSRIRTWQLVMLVMSGLIALCVAVAATPTGQAWLEVLNGRFDDFVLLVARTVPVIDFRYHIVSIVAIFLALATGVALGAGPLKGTVDQSYISQAEQ